MPYEGRHCNDGILCIEESIVIEAISSSNVLIAVRVKLLKACSDCSISQKTNREKCLRQTHFVNTTICSYCSMHYHDTERIAVVFEDAFCAIIQEFEALIHPCFELFQVAPSGISPVCQITSVPAVGQFVKNFLLVGILGFDVRDAVLPRKKFAFDTKERHSTERRRLLSIHFK